MDDTTTITKAEALRRLADQRTRAIVKTLWGVEVEK